MSKSWRADKRDYWDRNETYGWSKGSKNKDKKLSKIDKRLKVHSSMKRRIEQDRDDDYAL